MYNWCMFFVDAPLDTFTNCPNWISQSCPFPSAAAACSFHLSLLLMCIPSSLTTSCGLMRCPFRIMLGLSSGIHFFGTWYVTHPVVDVSISSSSMVF